MFYICIVIINLDRDSITKDIKNAVATAAANTK